MVVRTQRGGILFDPTGLGIDVLLFNQDCQSSCVFLSFVDYPLLVADFPLYLGRSAPLVIHGVAGMVSKLRSCFFSNVVGTVLGRYDQRLIDLTRSLG